MGSNVEIGFYSLALLSKILCRVNSYDCFRVRYLTSHCIELWALLHFIMPSLFDSHDEFNEWFSKDIENAAENKGSKLNEYQLRRLHMILKPFMLRRVKRHVQNELSEKVSSSVGVLISCSDLFVLRSKKISMSISLRGNALCIKLYLPMSL